MRIDGVWTISYAGKAVYLKHSKGFSYIKELLTRPHEEVDARELVERVAGLTARHEAEAQEVWDAATLSTVDRAIELLQEQLASADPEECIDIQQQLERLRAERARVVRLGGRSRAFPNPTERARKAVGQSIARAIRAIERVHPELARHLGQSIVNPFGRSVSYRPPHPVDWQV